MYQKMLFLFHMTWNQNYQFPIVSLMRGEKPTQVDAQIQSSAKIIKLQL